MSYTNGGVTWSMRGVAVEKQRGILAVSEDISFVGGSRFGYIRFYDIATNPQAPTLVGKEKLAEEFSGLPGRLALSGNYAYVATVGAGVQVVDIEAARNHAGTSDGSSIVGVLDTLGQGYGHPSDIMIVNGGRALVTTTGNYLITVDINVPSLPRVQSAFKPSGYQAFRAAVAAEYPFDDGSGGTQVMDLAVTGGSGQLNTVDITDPYNPRLIGTATDQAGNPVTTYAMDIAVSKNAGLAFVTTFSTIQIFDIKDPYHPVLMHTIAELPDSSGSMIPLGATAGLVEKDGWVYMANEADGMRVLDLAPVTLKLYCDEETALAGLSHQFCDDYYPAMGTKRVLVFGRGTDGTPLKPPAKLIVTNPNLYKDMGFVIEQSSVDFNDQGIAILSLATNDKYGKAPLAERTLLTFNVETDAETSARNGEPSAKILPISLNVRTNANVNFKEVLDGRAVFVADDGQSGGKTNWVQIAADAQEESDYVTKIFSTNLDKVRLDFVQELLNQVVTRKRSVTGYDLIGEDGQFGNGSANALKMFRENFAAGNTHVNFIANPDGTITYDAINTSPEGPSPPDNTSAIFRKMMKDYGIRAQGVTGVEKWLHKIVDQGTLVGETRKLYSEVNDPDETIGGDTGLYELYVNVVKRFVDGMIAEAERYAGKQPKDMMGPLPPDFYPKDQWYSRGDGLADAYGPTGCVVGTQCAGSHGSGMSYSYGGKQTIDEFNSIVSMWKAPPSSTYNSIALTSVNNYRGNCNETTGLIDTSVTRGSKRWAGLYSERPGASGTEYKAWVAFKNEKDAVGKLKNDEREHPFAPYYWAGIDCSGLGGSIAQARRTAGRKSVWVISAPLTTIAKKLVTPGPG